MRTGRLSAGVLLALVSAQQFAGAAEAAEAAEVPIPQLTETPEQREERLAWFREARFGLFIHWGPATISGEEISWGMDGRIEGGEKHKKVPRESYMNLYREFNPVSFDPDALLGLARAAGMRYVVFVAKHHDGFSLWPTAEQRFPAGADYPAHFSIADTPYGKDPVRMVQEAAQKHELRLGWYYSTRDWTHPDYLQGDNASYNTYYENQVEELLRDYGPVDMLWFDHCFGKWQDYTIPRLFRKMYAHNPELLVNNRAAKGLPDVPAEFLPLHSGDYDTPENRMGAFQFGRAWESCMILSPHPDHGGWSYRPDAVTRSLEETLRLLSSCVTGDGNMLLNLAPLPDGSIRPEEKAILEGIAGWMAEHGEAIHATRGGPWINGSWGGSSHRGSQVFLHVFDPEADPIVLKRLPQTVVAAATLKGEAVPFVQDDVAGTVSVTIPEHARDPSVSIIKLTLDSEVTGVLYQPALAAGRIEDVPGTLSFLPENADRTGAVMAGGESPVLRNWSDPEDLVSWSLEIDSPGTYTIELTTSAARPDAILTVLCGAKKLRYAHIPVTGDPENFQTYEIGEVTFANAESTRLTLRPVSHPTWSPVQVKKVRLIPSN